MREDMQKDRFAEYTFGKLALLKFAPTDPNFRLFEAEWMDGRTEVMKVTGAVFRKALSGANKGRLTLIVQGTARCTYITAKEMREYDEAKK